MSLHGEATPRSHGLTAGLYRGTITRVRAGRIWVRVPDVAGTQEFGGAKGIQYLDDTGLATTSFTTQPGGTDGHTHTVLRRAYAAGDSVLVAAVAGRITDLVVLGLLRP